MSNNAYDCGAATTAAPRQTEQDRRATADPDPDVVHRVLTGHREAYSVLMRRYQLRLYRIARAITRDGAEAEDVVQESWIRAFGHLSRLSDPSRFGSWLARLTVNQALLRRRQKAARQALLDTVVEAATTTRETPESLTLRRELGPLIESAVAALPEPFRVVFVLREVDGMSVAEIGEHLDVPEATVKTRAFRARELLRTRLAESDGCRKLPRNICSGSLPRPERNQLDDEGSDLVELKASGVGSG